MTIALSWASALILNEYFNIGFRIKYILRKPLKRFLNKNHWEIIKPFDCRFCMYFWISNIITLSLAFKMIIPITIIVVCINTFYAHLTANYYDKKEV